MTESPANEATAASDAVSRETPSELVSRETEFDTPIAREAAQALHVLNVRQEQWPRPPATRVMTVANQKTTPAVNVAAALALHGLRVLLIDLDPQGNASTALGVAHGVGTPSVYDVLLGGSALATVATSVDFADTLHCVPATLDLAGADIELTSQVAREYRLQRAVGAFLDEGHGFDYIFIDCPPSLGLLTLNALTAATSMLVPTQCEYFALEGLRHLLYTHQLVRSRLNPELEIAGILMTQFDARTTLSWDVLEEVRRSHPAHVLKTIIPRNVRISEAPSHGKPVIQYDPTSRGAAAYRALAKELLER